MSNSGSDYTAMDAVKRSKLDAALEHSKSRLSAEHAERSAQRRARYAEDARMQARIRDLMFGDQLRSKEVELKQLAEDRRKLIEGRPKLVRRPLLTKGLPIQPSPATPFTYARTPPYDFTWTSGSGQGTETATTDGFIDLFVQGLGDERSVAGAIGFWFQAAAQVLPCGALPPASAFLTSGRKGQRFMLPTITGTHGSWCGACPRTPGSLRAAIKHRPGRTTSAGMNRITIATLVPKRLRSCFSMSSRMVGTSAGSIARPMSMRIMASRAFPIQRSVCTLHWRLCLSHEPPNESPAAAFLRDLAAARKIGKRVRLYSRPGTISHIAFLSLSRRSRSYAHNPASSMGKPSRVVLTAARISIAFATGIMTKVSSLCFRPDRARRRRLAPRASHGPQDNAGAFLASGLRLNEHLDEENGPLERVPLS